MDGFPNGRRLEDDVVRIELQAVSGIALAAIGLWYDDYNCVGSPVTTDLVDVLSYNAGVTSNDAPMKSSFPYVARPWAGTHNCDCDEGQITTNNKTQEKTNLKPSSNGLGISAPEMNLSAYPNPSNNNNTIKYSVDVPSQVKIVVYDMQGKLVKILADKKHDAGVYTIQWENKNLTSGTNTVKQTIKLVKN
jgi:hypothetical protein